MHETLDDYAIPHQDSREWIPKKPESATDLQRESIILAEIKKKPYFQHNRLVEKIVKDHRSMAKTTCEKTIKRLLEKHLVRVDHDKKNIRTKIKTFSIIKAVSYTQLTMPTNREE